MASLAQSPVELYLHTSYEPDAEFVDGEVELRPMGEFDHATWQQALQAWFLLHGSKWGVRVRPELRVQVGTTRFRVPDVVVFDRNAPTEQILTVPPIAVFEVLSPEDSLTRTLAKLADYESMGVRNIFVVDPRAELFYRYASGDLELCRQNLIQLDGSAAEVDWAGVAALRD